MDKKALQIWRSLFLLQGVAAYKNTDRDICLCPYFYSVTVSSKLLRRIH